MDAIPYKKGKHMRILLINSNPVVSRLIALCTRESAMQLTEILVQNEIGNVFYDVVFIDDAALASFSDTYIASLHTDYIVLLSATHTQCPDFIDEVIKKPFLPSSILNLLENLKQEVYQEREEHTVSSEINAEETTDTSPYTNEILDLNEIERIKSLLDMDEEERDEPLWANEEELEDLKRKVIKQNLIDDGLEIIEDDLMSALESNLSLTVTHPHTATKEDQKTFEEKLLEAIVSMKIKKIKKLLRGAKVTINIEFKEENHV